MLIYGGSLPLMTHQFLALVLRVRVQRVLGAGVAVVLLRGIHGERGLIEPCRKKGVSDD